MIYNFTNTNRVKTDRIRSVLNVQGDSGGPLQVVLDNPYCMYSVVGVTSFGKFCGFKNSPAVYTRVSSYVPWIESVVWK